MPFAHEILDDYDKVLFFDPFNSEELYESMLKILTLEEKNLDKKVSKYPDSFLWNSVISTTQKNWFIMLDKYSNIL